jgi:hypothetical protein
MAQPNNVNPYWLGQYSSTAPTSVLPSTVTIAGTSTTAAIIPYFLPNGILQSNGGFPNTNAYYVSTMGTYASDIQRPAISSGTYYTFASFSNLATGNYWYTFSLEAAPTQSIGSNWTTSDLVLTYAQITNAGNTSNQLIPTQTISRPYYQGYPTNVIGSISQGYFITTISGMANITSAGASLQLIGLAVCFSNGGSNVLAGMPPALKYMTIYNPTLQKVG